MKESRFVLSLNISECPAYQRPVTFSSVYRVPKGGLFLFFGEKNESKSRERLEEGEAVVVEVEWKIPPSCSVKCPPVAGVEQAS